MGNRGMDTTVPTGANNNVEPIERSRALGSVY